MNSSLSPRAAIGLFLIVVLAWGVNWSMTKQIVQFLPPLWTSAIRSWIALAGLFVILGLSNNLVIPERRDIPVVLSVAPLRDPRIEQQSGDPGAARYSGGAQRRAAP